MVRIFEFIMGNHWIHKRHKLTEDAEGMSIHAPDCSDLALLSKQMCGSGVLFLYHSLWSTGGFSTMFSLEKYLKFLIYVLKGCKIRNKRWLFNLNVVWYMTQEKVIWYRGVSLVFGSVLRQIKSNQVKFSFNISSPNPNQNFSLLNQIEPKLSIVHRMTMKKTEFY